MRRALAWLKLEDCGALSLTSLCLYAALFWVSWGVVRGDHLNLVDLGAFLTAAGVYQVSGLRRDKRVARSDKASAAESIEIENAALQKEKEKLEREVEGLKHQLALPTRTPLVPSNLRRG